MGQRCYSLIDLGHSLSVARERGRIFEREGALGEGKKPLERE